MQQTEAKSNIDTYDELFAGTGSILRTLGYFDIFHYPLTRDEIRNFLQARTDDRQFDAWLSQLVAEEKIFRFKDFYSLHDNPLLAYRRIQGNEKAARLLRKATRIGRFLYQFPFVRGIGISGSLSKNFADERADIDFFIIAKHGRLWIARTFMHFYKKLTFLTGRQHYYCMNYYIDEHSLQLTDENIFTATEVKTLLPVSGETTMHAFFTANQWANKWLPACSFRQQELRDPRASWIKRMAEWMLSNGPGDRLEQFLFKLTRNRWNRKTRKEKRNKKGARMALVTGEHYAKSNPDDFQEKVLGLYRQKLSGIRTKLDHAIAFRAT